MMTATPGDWTVRGATFALWLAAAASTVAWGLKLAGGSAPPAVAPATTQAAPVPQTDAIARLLAGAAAPAGTAGPAAAATARLQLLGVVAGTRSREGAALIAVDGKPARPFRVGTAVADNLVVQAVEGRRAVLGPAGGAATLTLELPPLRK